MEVQFKHGVFLVEVTISLLFYSSTDDKSTAKQLTEQVCICFVEKIDVRG